MALQISCQKLSIPGIGLRNNKIERLHTFHLGKARPLSRRVKNFVSRMRRQPRNSNTMGTLNMLSLRDCFSRAVLEWFRLRFPVLLHQNFNLAFGLIQLFSARVRELYTFLG